MYSLSIKNSNGSLYNLLTIFMLSINNRTWLLLASLKFLKVLFILFDSNFSSFSLVSINTSSISDLLATGTFEINLPEILLIPDNPFNKWGD